MEIKKLAFLGFVAIGLSSNLWGKTAEGTGYAQSSALKEAHDKTRCYSDEIKQLVDRTCEETMKNYWTCIVIYECVKR